MQRNDVLYSCATPKRGGFTCAHVQPDNESAPWYCKVRAKPPCNNTPMQIASNTPRVYVTLTATRSASFSLRTRSMFAEHRTSNALPSPSSQASIISTLLKIAETFSLVVVVVAVVVLVAFKQYRLQRQRSCVTSYRRKRKIFCKSTFC